MSKIKKAPYDKLFLDPVVAKNPVNAVQYLENEIEYIRKDVLLEWLKQSKQEMEQDLKGSDGLIKAMIATAISSFQEVIEKIESL